MTKLLVIGGTDGQVALALSRLKPDDVEIIVRGKPDLDMLDPASMTRVIAAVAPDVVACVGAYTAVDQAETDRDIAARLNGEAPGHIARACAARGTPLIHISTDYVFDGTKSGAYLPDDKPNPLTVYGATKLAGEQAVAAAGGRHAILRTSWVFAAEGKNFVRTMLRLAKVRDRLGVVDDQTGYPTYAGFIADTILAVARRMTSDRDAASGVFHMVGEGTVTWRGFAEAIFAGSKARGGPQVPVDPIPTSAYPTPARRPANSVLDPSSLAAAYDVRLPHWRKGLDLCLDAIAAGGWDVG